MQNNTMNSQVLRTEEQEIIEIKLWGLYLFINRVDVYHEMIESSLDHGPVEKNPQKPGRITFRFSAKAWETKIKKLLYSCRIPVVINAPTYQRLQR
jgi:hypothetical protein